MSDKVLDLLYLIGYGIAFTSLAYQTYKIYKTKYIRGLTIPYLLGNLVAKFLALPRTILSTYWVWWLQEGIATLLTILFVVGAIIYGRDKNKKGGEEDV